MVTTAEYLSALKANLARGDATEHTHRPALKALLESLAEGITATNEPKRIACGAPDLIITRKATPLGHVETKDIGTSLDEVEGGRGPGGEQFLRYLRALPNWILTDYLEFRWYVGAQKRMTARLASYDGGKEIHALPNGDAETTHLFRSFLAEPAPTVDTAKDLAKRMAATTDIVRDLIRATFKRGSLGDRRRLAAWLAAFREVLIPDLDQSDFADMLAQTLAYGLFAARVHSLRSGEPFTRESAAFLLPKTNPFLRKLFAEVAGVDMPDTFRWAADDLVRLLDHANWGRVLREFGAGRAKHDPIVHFYETFLAAYDPEVRELRGVYYTPEPVAGYIVRSIERLLADHFGKAKGLADEDTLILDPAVGTATFPFSVIQRVYARFERQKGAWNSYVSEHLLNRLFGFELLMAPYAVAHLKLGMELQATGYRFGSEHRLGIYLTNTLEEAAKKSQKLFAQWISDEANDAAEIKRTRPILVVLGNPPYSGHSANRSRDERGNLTFIGKLIEDYKMVDGEPLGEKNPKWLQDDYVKFIRFAQWRIERTGHGVLGFVTNHRYLYNPTFRGMRQQLMLSFDDIYIYDLHGNSRNKERSPDGREDRNVFDIQQGVAIILGVRRPGKRAISTVRHADLWGGREEKYATLSGGDVSTTAWKELKPTKPYYAFTPGGERLQGEYSAGWLLSAAMPINSIGVVTARDSLTIHFTRREVWDTVQDFMSLPAEEARSKYGLGRDVRDWRVANAQRDLLTSGPREDAIVPILYRPFDVRFTYFTGNSRGFHCYPRRAVMAHMLAGPNIGLATSRNVETEAVEHFFCSQYVMGHHAVSLKEVNFLYPLYIYADGEHHLGEKSLFSGRRLNLSREFLGALAARLRRRQDADGLPEGVSGEDIAAYAYAVFYSPSYRARYEEFLRRDFPRLPLTSDAELFSALAVKGRALLDLHLMRGPHSGRLTTDYPVEGENIVRAVSYDSPNQRVLINRKQYFGGVEKEVWESRLGGYQVCEQWLKDRKGRTLTYDDVQCWQRIVSSLRETTRIMREIDSLVPCWPLP